MRRPFDRSLGSSPLARGAPLFVEPCDLVEGGSHECDAFCVDAGLFFGDPFVPAPLPGRGLSPLGVRACTEFRMD